VYNSRPENFKNLTRVAHQKLWVSVRNPYAVRRGGCLELYYCNMVEWFWWDWSLISATNWFPSVLWHCWFGHLVKIVPDMTYNVSSGTLTLYTTTCVQTHLLANSEKARMPLAAVGPTW